MKPLFSFLFFSCGFLISTAQNLSVERDSIRSTKDTVSLSITNNMLTDLYIKITPKKKKSDAIVYKEYNLLKPNEKLNDFVKIPRSILPTYDAPIGLTDYFNFKFGYADPKNVSHDDNYVYLLPYKNKRKMIQAYFGKFSHNDIETYYALDFGTKIGDTIYAARGGKVVMTREDSKKHGKTRAFIADANYLIIQHDDDTTASYFHLDFNGVLVEKGDIVTRGQAIGISGLTGFTTTPHLHFVVHKTTLEEGNVSIPIQFKNHIGKKFRKGKKYARKRK